MRKLIEAAVAVRARGYAPYSQFQVGAAIRAELGDIFAGCNVENAAYPQGMCAEAGAVAAMVAGGQKRIVEIVVSGMGDLPCAPCGGCRQKLREFAGAEVPVHMVDENGALVTHAHLGRAAAGQFRSRKPALMLPQEFLRRKRDGGVLAPADIAEFIAGLTNGRVTEGQAAAFAMAVFFRGMTAEETVALTLAMRDSGTILDWRALGEDRPVVDKHSTGGIGDKVSLILAPLLAACGAVVPMISGRGLGHTGGTLDKMDAIPGYRSQPSREEFVRAVRETGCAIVGATDDLAPADRRLYAIRDVTATVESLPLIVASILSKKLAEGAQSLVMDVKVGSGAFFTQEAEARKLAETLVRVASGAGVPTIALLTDMDQALGRTVGNALELREAVDFLAGGPRDPRLETVTLALAAETLALCGLCPGVRQAETLARERLADGSAAEKLAGSVAALGGPPDFLQRVGSYLAPAPVVRPVLPERPGWITAMDARALGVAVVELGGGRTRPQDGIDHRVGLSAVAGIGEQVGPDRPLCLVHAADEASGARASVRITAAYSVGKQGHGPACIRDRITAHDR